VLASPEEKERQTSTHEKRRKTLLLFFKNGIPNIHFFDDVTIFSHRRDKNGILIEMLASHECLLWPCRKLFVGGLSWETTQDSLQRYFSRYGEVIDCVVMKNNETGRSRGFGFM
jgi:RNA recognition motif-containing protein